MQQDMQPEANNDPDGLNPNNCTTVNRIINPMLIKLIA